MTDEQIEKALECCLASPPNCEECAYTLEFGCVRQREKDTLALIKRQKAEIEKLIDECGSQSVLWRDNYASVYETAKGTIKAEARAEAIREVIERVEERLSSIDYTANTKRKTVTTEELKEQVNWILHEVVPQILAALKREMMEE